MKRERFACTFQKDGSSKKMFPGCKTGKRPVEDLHLKGTKEKILIKCCKWKKRKVRSL